MLVISVLHLFDKNIIVAISGCSASDRLLRARCVRTGNAQNASHLIVCSVEITLEAKCVHMFYPLNLYHCRSTG